MNSDSIHKDANPVQRVRIWYALLLLVFGVFAVRLFYLQVIRYDYYKNQAMNDQLRQSTVAAARGTIVAHLGDGTVPIVMNQKLYTLYADPTMVKDAAKSASKVQAVVGGNVDDIEALLKTPKRRYVVIKRKLSPELNKKVLALELPGIGTQEQDYRTYPQGTLAAQTLGFVNNDGMGVYGVEQALNKELTGKSGQLKAVTDVRGVPLAASGNNLSVAPVQGKQVQLTLDVGMQAGLEKIVQEARDMYKSKAVSAVVMDVHTGAVKAMANYPSYDPANYQKVDDAALFQNLSVSNPIEPGSITKLFTIATGLQQGSITPTSGFNDPGVWQIDGGSIADVAEDHSNGPETVFSTIDKSLNTGAVWVLMQMGGGQLNSKGRTALYDGFTNKFMLGQPTGIEQGYEASGYVPKPADTGAGINLTYANMSFGQAYTATALQMCAGLSTMLNGGTYYQPTLVESVAAEGQKTTFKPKVVKNSVVSKETSDGMISLLEQNQESHIRAGFRYLDLGPNYSAGGKTGTAEIAKPEGGYYKEKVNSTYLGFVGGDTPQYAIVVYNLEPTHYSGYAGVATAQPIYSQITHMLVNNFGVTPKRQ